MKPIILSIFFLLTFGCSSPNIPINQYVPVQRYNSINTLPNHIVRINASFENNENGFSSGILIYKDKQNAYILTNRHCVEFDNKLALSISIDSFEYNQFYKLKEKKNIAKLISISDQSKDIAILRCDPDILSKPVKINPIIDQIGTKTFLAGYPRTDLLITEGILTTYFAENGKFLIRSSSFVEVGASGGGLFDEDGNLIGMTKGYAAYSGGIYKVNNSGIFISIIDIYRYIKENKLDFLLNN
jgi:S1-C subfamily serine protease